VLLATKPRADFEREFFDLLGAPEEEGGAGMGWTEVRRYRVRPRGRGGEGEGGGGGGGGGAATDATTLTVDVDSGEVPSREDFADEDVRVLLLHRPALTSSGS
jgi:hypothetical protein